jgi:hypothetical protein
MPKITMKLTANGREVSPDQFGNAILNAALENITNQVRSKLENIVCPVNGKHIEVVVVGESLETLKFNFEGCCQTAIALAANEFSAGASKDQ